MTYAQTYTCPICGQPMALVEDPDRLKGPLPDFNAPAQTYRCEAHGLWLLLPDDGSFSRVTPDPGEQRPSMNSQQVWTARRSC